MLHILSLSATDQELAKSIIYILVGISILLVGMKMMSGGLKKCIGKGVKVFFKKTENNPAVSMGIGTVVTAGIQSSDATNAMVVGFINAGAMGLYQGLCIMLGAYIGTTVTGIIAAFSSLSISMYFLLFSFIGVVMTFIKKESVKNIGEILCGLGFLFFALGLMKDAFGNVQIRDWCQNLFASIKFGPLLFLIGILLAALVQSSSAITSIVIAMVGSSALALNAGLYVVLGATLGTVTNTLLSSLGGNTEGKRAAIIIFILRALTSLVMLIFLCIFESNLSYCMHVFAVNGSDELPIALFTLFYNLIFMPALLPLLKPCISFAHKHIKDSNIDALQASIHFIDDKLLISPDIALEQVKKEILNMYDLSINNYNMSLDILLNNNISLRKTLNENEEKIDYLNERITNFLISLSNKAQLSREKEIGTYFHVINDIERIGDHAYNFSEMENDMNEKDFVFSKDAVIEIKEFDSAIKDMFILSRDIFVSKDEGKLNLLHELNIKTDDYKRRFSMNHFLRITDKKCANELSPYYSNLLAELKRIADHLNNIGYSIVNPVGNE